MLSCLSNYYEDFAPFAHLPPSLHITYNHQSHRLDHGSYGTHHMLVCSVFLSRFVELF